MAGNYFLAFGLVHYFYLSSFSETTFTCRFYRSLSRTFFSRKRYALPRTRWNLNWNKDINFPFGSTMKTFTAYICLYIYISFIDAYIRYMIACVCWYTFIDVRIRCVFMCVRVCVSASVDTSNFPQVAGNWYIWLSPLQNGLYRRGVVNLTQMTLFYASYRFPSWVTHPSGSDNRGNDSLSQRHCHVELH